MNHTSSMRQLLACPANRPDTGDLLMSLNILRSMLPVPLHPTACTLVIRTAAEARGTSAALAQCAQWVVDLALIICLLSYQCTNKDKKKEVDLLIYKCNNTS
jgi:hypothetical protein